MTPTILWAWTFVFAAPFVRVGPEPPKRELALAMAASAVAGAVVVVLVTIVGADVYLLHTGQNRLWVGSWVALFWVQLPLLGAVFGALSVALWRGQRSLWLRSAGAGSPLLVAALMALTWKWTSPSTAASAPRDLIAVIMVPAMFWALGLLFFSLVARGRSPVFGQKTTVVRSIEIESVLLRPKIASEARDDFLCSILLVARRRIERAPRPVPAPRCAGRFSPLGYAA